jgi:hypothetical protein
MAKKKGTGTNLGLIITLVFFVLTTVILGVTTYMGYSDQEVKEAAKKEAEKQKGIADADKDYYRMQVRVLRDWIGYPAVGVEATQVASDKKKFDDNQYPPAANQKDKEDVVKVFKTLNNAMPWDAAKDMTPTLTFEQRLTKLGTEVADWKTKTKKAEDAVKKVEQEKKDAEDAKDKEIAALKKSYADFSAKLDGELKAGLTEIGGKRALAEEEGKKRAELSKKMEDALRNAAKLAKDLKEVEAKLVAATNDKKKALVDLAEAETKVAALSERSGIDKNAIEAASLDASARKVLDAWTKSWRVVDLDRRGDNAYISIGSNEGLTPQVTFSIHSVGPNGKLNPVPKGTVEVVRVMGGNQAVARITSTKDAKKDPILKGDRLFNPTWDPNRQRRVAIVGIADLGGDGSDSSDDLRRLLARQKVTLDAYIDTKKEEKKPKLVGKGVSVNTDYLIIGEGLEGSRDPRAKEKEYAAEFTRISEKLREDAKNNGVAIISLRRYLDMIGYQPPKIVNIGGNR